MKKEKLHNIESTGFKTTDSYFESFDDKLLQRITNESKILGVKSTGFKTPHNYFESIETDISNSLNNKKSTKIISLFSRKRLAYVSGLAASIVLLFSLLINQQNKPDIDTIDVAAIESYLYQQDYSTDEFASLFELNEISETDFINVEISEETLNEYLENSEAEDFLLD